MKRQLTNFQRRCVARLEEFLDRKNTEFRQASGGQNEVFVILSFEYQSRGYEIYVYEDEVGYAENGSWKIWEVPDYDSTGDLFEAFMDDLQASFEASD